MVFYKNGEITDEMVEYSFKAIYSFITIKEAEEFGNFIGCNFISLRKEEELLDLLQLLGCLWRISLMNCWRIGCLKIMVLKDTLIMIPFI